MAKTESTENIASDLEAFIREQFCVTDDDSAFARGANLWEEGYVDSTGLVELIAFLEERFEVVLPDEVLFDPAFTSIDGIASCVVRVLQG